MTEHDQREKRSTPFAKGKSGKPKGRPTRRVNIENTRGMMGRVLSEPCPMKVDGEPLNWLEAVYYALHQLALEGKPAAQKLWDKLMKDYGIEDLWNEPLSRHDPEAFAEVCREMDELVEQFFDRLDAEREAAGEPDQDGDPPGGSDGGGLVEV